MYDSQNSDILTSVPNQNLGKKSVILTFDDGPSRVLPDLLDILKETETPATFFWQSRLLHAEKPWKRVLAEGHQIGTHTTKHKNLIHHMTQQQQYNDIKKSVEQIELITGVPVKFFRPPYGQFNDDTLQAAKRLHLETVLWRIASMDWELKDDHDKIISNITDHLENGAILLMHELSQTVTILPRLILAIKDQGYEFKSLSSERRN